MKYSLSVFLFLMALFMFTRIAFIRDSFLYLNDMGRDSLVLLDWQKTNKPPLLGPQTSALPFNQSAFYFYLLFPAFLITKGSPYAALLTVNVFYLVVLSATFWLIYRSKQKNVMNTFLVSVLGIVLHPQFIIQTRFVWNPSFVGPLLFCSFFLLYLLSQNFSWKKVIALGMTLALAVSLSYSVAPILLGFGLASLLYLKKKSVLVGISLTGWLLFFNLPTLFFEVRHHFLLTQMILHQEKIKQVGTDLASKTDGLLNFALTTYPASWQKLLALFFIILIAIGTYVFIKKENNIFRMALVIFLTGLITTLIFPVPILAHYIFGLVTLGFILIASLPSKVRIAAVTIFICVWSLPILNFQYFKTATRTVSQMESCYTQFCKNETSPIFVSLQSGILPFHNGPEHRYLLRKAGCDVKDIETEATSANKMAVVVESSEFTFGKTDYAELSAFKPQQLTNVLSCQTNLQVYTLSR